MGFFAETTDDSREMNRTILAMAGRGPRQPLSAGPAHDRLSAALSDFERIKHLPDDADEKVYAGMVLERALTAAEQERLHPRNPDGTYATFDGGVQRRAGKPNPGFMQQESPTALIQRAMLLHHAQREADDS